MRLPNPTDLVRREAEAAVAHAQSTLDSLGAELALFLPVILWVVAVVAAAGLATAVVLSVRVRAPEGSAGGGRHPIIPPPHRSTEDAMNPLIYPLLLVALFAAAPGLAQSAVGDAPPALPAADPPTEALERFAPFFGTYDLSGVVATAGEAPYHGTLDVRPAVNGWFVEWVFDMNGGDRQTELRMLATYDEEAGAYRIWRFESRGMGWPPGHVGTVRFEGDELVMEWDGRAPDGVDGTFRNRVTREGRDLRIVTEGERPGRGVTPLIESEARRVL